jgi:hypothetical protein
MVSVFKKFLLGCVLLAALASSGCISCLPYYVPPPEGPVSACYPVGHDPYIPMDHNPSLFHPWDFVASVFRPFLYGPPR